MQPNPPADLFAGLGEPASLALTQWLQATNRTLHHVDWLTGGHSRAVVAVVVMNEPGTRAAKRILKLCPPRDDEVPPETSRHREAIHRAPRAFGRRHLVTLPYGPVPVPDGGLLLIQEIADGSLTRHGPLEQVLHDRPETLGRVCASIVKSLLDDWNHETRLVDLPVAEFLQANLVRRVRPAGPTPSWFDSALAMLSGTEPWVSLTGEPAPLPNPLALLLETPLSAGLQEPALVGHSHGDLHLGNVLVAVQPEPNPATYRLIDLAWYRPDAPLTRDPQKLLVSIVAGCLKDLSHPQREALRCCLLESDPAAEALLPVWLRDTIVKVRQATETWARGCGFTDEWVAQSQLSLIAAALPWLGRDAVPGDAGASRRWFLRLAAHAGAAYLQTRGHPGDRITIPAAPSSTPAHHPDPTLATLRPPTATGGEPEPALTAAEHAALEGILAGVHCPAAAALYDAAVAPLGPRRSRRDGSLPGMARQLTEVTGLPGEPPPLLVFLERVAHAVGGGAAVALRAWTAAFATRHHIDADTLEGVRALPPPSPAARRSYLMVQLEPDRVRPRRYLPSASLHHHTGRIESCWETDEPLTLKGVKVRLDAVIDEVLEEHGVELGELAVELFLPHALLDQPVDQWHCGRAPGSDSLGVEHPVVVRSFERLRQRKWHQHWEQKWRWMKDHGDQLFDRAVEWRDRPERSPSSFRTFLISGMHLTCLGLSFAPKRINYRNNDEVSVGIAAGIPILLWCRDQEGAGAIKSEIGKLMAGRSVHELPERVFWLRRQAAQHHGDTHPIGRELTLLWDDFDRQPATPPRLQAPA